MVPNPPILQQSHIRPVNDGRTGGSLFSIASPCTRMPDGDMGRPCAMHLACSLDTVENDVDSFSFLRNRDYKRQATQTQRWVTAAGQDANLGGYVRVRTSWSPCLPMTSGSRAPTPPAAATRNDNEHTVVTRFEWQYTSP